MFDQMAAETGQRCHVVVPAVFKSQADVHAEIRGNFACGVIAASVGPDDDAWCLPGAFGDDAKQSLANALGIDGVALVTAIAELMADNRCRLSIALRVGRQTTMQIISV